MRDLRIVFLIVWYGDENEPYITIQNVEKI